MVEDLTIIGKLRCMCFSELISYVRSSNKNKCIQLYGMDALHYRIKYLRSLNSA